ncbi:unnamed protein product [Brachionus calyciflorus]|uniref:Uncharacterized protein n=1 Tax=Brachionus calyciflorus TaxID=104777 RepID=A0A814I6J8_9BILA|nr:unnamed protein product [Brachionus calyciflorus]
MTVGDKIPMDPYQLLHKFNHVDKLDECIYTKFYYTKQKGAPGLIDCNFCGIAPAKTTSHKMQKFYRECHCFNQQCDLKLKILICHVSQKYYVYSKGTHQNKKQNKSKISELNQSNNSLNMPSNVNGVYQSTPLITRDAFVKLFLNCDYIELDAEEYSDVIKKNNIKITNNCPILKMIKFERDETSQFVKAFLKYEITDEFSQPGYTPGSIHFYQNSNCVTYKFKCKKCISNKVFATFFIDYKLLILQLRGNLCDCKFF